MAQWYDYAALIALSISILVGLPTAITGIVQDNFRTMTWGAILFFGPTMLFLAAILIATLLYVFFGLDTV